MIYVFQKKIENKLFSCVYTLYSRQNNFKEKIFRQCQVFLQIQATCGYLLSTEAVYKPKEK